MPKMRKVGAHCPTNKERWSSPSSFIVRDTKIDPRAAQRKRSEGSLAVCCSRARATGPSECWMASLMVIQFEHQLMGDCLCSCLFIGYLRRGWPLGCTRPRWRIRLNLPACDCSLRCDELRHPGGRPTSLRAIHRKAAINSPITATEVANGLGRLGSPKRKSGSTSSD